MFCRPSRRTTRLMRSCARKGSPLLSVMLEGAPWYDAQRITTFFELLISIQDVISYTVDSLCPFLVKESTKGDGQSLAIPTPSREKLTVNATGKLCGAFRIDEAFEAHLKSKTKLKFSSLEQGEYNVFVAQDWEMGAKRAFTEKPDPPRFVLRPPSKAFKTIARIR